MSRTSAIAELVLASHNPGKLEELREILRGFDLRLSGAGDHGCEAPEESEASFEGNARIKARHVADQTGRPALADDSGIEIAALGGAPGVHSADWAEVNEAGRALEARDFAMAMARVERKLAGAAQPIRANFTCVLCLAFPNGEDNFFRGEVHGSLRFPPSGERGFGYDPIFVPEGYSESFGEMEPAAKARISHRARAFEKLLSSGLLG